MLISRKLAHKVQNQLQLILSLFETGNGDQAKTAIRELGMLISRHIESAQDEQSRLTRENEPDD
jgi:hypothetical protein